MFLLCVIYVCLGIGIGLEPGGSIIDSLVISILLLIYSCCVVLLEGVIEFIAFLRVKENYNCRVNCSGS